MLFVHFLHYLLLNAEIKLNDKINNRIEHQYLSDVQNNCKLYLTAYLNATYFSLEIYDLEIWKNYSNRYCYKNS